MLDIAPTPTSVFTSEYWEDRELYPKAPGLKMQKGTLSEVEGLCSQAAANVFADEPREAVIAGTALDYDPDNRYTQPGVVLLTDLEVRMASPSRREPHSYAGSDFPIWSQRAMEDPMDLVAPAAVLFRRNSRMIAAHGKTPELPYVYPYERVFQDQESGARYARIVGLTAFTLNEDGSTAGFTIKSWTRGDPAHPKGHTESLLDGIWPPLHAPVTIGQSYDVPDDKKINPFGSRRDISPKSELTVRLRSAELCIQGVLQRATETQKAKRSLVRRALSALPSPARLELADETTT